MALTDKLDQATIDKLVKKTLIASGKEVITKKQIVKISSSFTSLQNSFNAIYTHSLNVRNLHQYEEKRTQFISKESNLENASGPSAGSIADAVSGSGPDFTNTAKLFDELSDSIEKLNDKLSGLDLSGGSGLAEIAGGLAGEVAGAKTGAQIGGKVAGARGAAVGGFIGGVMGYFGGSNIAGNIERRAVGGSVKAGGTYVVGERGPEVLTFAGGNGRIIPNGAAGRTLQAEKYLLTAAEQSARSRARFEAGKPIGPTSYSSKFSSYLSTLFMNMPSWVGKLKDWLGISGDGGGGSEVNLGSSVYTPVGDLSKVKGDWKNDKEFLTAIDDVSRKYDIDANDLLGLIRHETAGSMSPTEGVGTNAVGLFQFTKKGGGFDTDAIAKMSRAGQVRLADRKIFAASGMPRGANAGQLYAAVYLPAVAARAGWQGTLARNGELFYTANPSLDNNKDGQIDVGDLARVVDARRRELGLGSSPSISGVGPQGDVKLGGEAGKRMKVTSVIKMRKHPTEGVVRMHEGFDIVPGEDAKSDLIASATMGTVVKAGQYDNESGYGNIVVVQGDDGRYYAYAHMKSVSVREKQTVNAGTILGVMGNTGIGTGAHLHFEIRLGPNAGDRTIKNNNVVSKFLYDHPWVLGAERGSAAQVSKTTAQRVVKLPSKDFKVIGESQGKFNFIVTPTGSTILPSHKSAKEAIAHNKLTAGSQGAKDIEAYFKLNR